MLVNLIFLIALNLSTSEIGAYLREKGMPIQLNGINLVQKENLGSSYDVFEKLYFAFNAKAYKHVIREVLYNGETSYSLGTALVGKGFSYSACSDLNERAIEICKASIAHELGHSVFRLKHTEGCSTLMDTSALGCQNLKELGFSASQKMKMSFVLKKRRKNELRR